MSDDVRYGAAPADVKGYDTAALRSAFLVSGLFPSDRLKLVYTHVDRMIVGGCAPAAMALAGPDRYAREGAASWSSRVWQAFVGDINGDDQQRLAVRGELRDELRSSPD
jgi:5-keto 4-deoxyuronate isomerase